MADEENEEIIAILEGLRGDSQKNSKQETSANSPEPTKDSTDSDKEQDSEGIDTMDSYVKLTDKEKEEYGL